MIGAIIGDIAGSRFEFVEDDHRDKNFDFFGRGCTPTDDSFMTLAVAKALYISKCDPKKLKDVVVSCMRSVRTTTPIRAGAASSTAGCSSRTAPNPTIVSVTERV